MKKNNKGFTLIELLAIIVILAIIAVITVPIILNIIENSRKGAASDSAYGFKDSVNKTYIAELQNHNKLKLNDTYTVTNGTLSGGNFGDEGITSLPVSVSGTIPTSGSLTYSNNTLTSGCLVIGEYAVTFANGNVSDTKKGGTCSTAVTGLIIPDSFTRIVDGVAYASAIDIKDNPIYYNPVSNQQCESGDEEGTYTTDTGYKQNMEAAEGSTYPKTGCLKWYAYSYENGKVNMILAHNTTATKEWVGSQADYADGVSVGISYPNYPIPTTWYGENYSGPVTALKQLKADTSSWSSDLLRSDSYSARITDAYTYTINYGETRDESGEVESTAYKARLISAEEIAAITNNSPWTGSLDFYLQNGEPSPLHGGSNFPTYEEGETSDYSWLYDYTRGCTGGSKEYGCTVNADSTNSTYGYWTSSPYTGNYDYATLVNFVGLLSSNSCKISTSYGIRPVITVSASVVSS